jgi:ech hydrogenase subunit D
MSTEQIEVITLESLLDQVRTRQKQGCRLVQISATQLPGQVELTYSFDLDSRLSNLRLSLPAGAHLPSITPVYGCAVLYENEIHDLFGVPVDGMSIDFQGNLYKTSVKFPFGSAKSPCAAGSASCATPDAKPQ